jgi:hypothetical protein
VTRGRVGLGMSDVPEKFRASGWGSSYVCAPGFDRISRWRPMITPTGSYWSHAHLGAGQRFDASQDRCFGDRLDGLLDRLAVHGTG